MRKLGISLYPEKSSFEELTDYIDVAAEAGFNKIFTSLLQIEGSGEEIVQRLKEANEYAKNTGFEIIVDVSPRIFDALRISYNDLSFFKKIGADGIRLDATYSGREEAMMSYNPYNLKIEMNISNDVHMIDNVMDYAPNKYNLLGSHNFYPHRYSGLSRDFFIKTTKRFTANGIRTSAFVSSQNKETFGPWPVTDGLPTLEMHRNLPLDVQIKHHLAMNVIDDIIISNCYPSYQELQSVSELDLSLVTLDVKPINNLPEIEKKILFEELHFNRGDINEYFIRSTQSRVKYKGHPFDLMNAPDIIRRGDVLIESSLYGHYAGEMQIALRDMENSGKTNVVGRVREEEIFILDEIQPWQKFRLRMSED
ncbi:DUF871 domain-containing protein [Facklamia miroungae]|uniref:Outer surface protein n=1 Tax=Facklamia miroungae TaxID=120956 RepID=A0A1G7RWL9_9LACT|nr:MupG family TIM beta-alpha barrel fold protein [Facklamia miroungae]NKZ29248.1 DUF871 domain-containing protein [Facklamia miroungae]SDG15146.1 hypothetical protein SAMN05421791_103207 [Facklamia miroungae]